MRRTVQTVVVFLFFGLFSLQAAIAEEEVLDDARKLKIVYRKYYEEYKRDFPAVKDVTPQQAMALLSKGRVVFVDTREPAEMEVSMLPGAVTKEQFLQSPQKRRDQIVIGYCTISYRSGVFARQMARKGVTIYNLAGGILAWTLEGGKIIDENGKATRRLHVYGDKWDYAPQGYETVKFSLWQQIF